MKGNNMGRYNTDDLLNMKFGDGTVIEKVPSKHKNRWKWKLRCQCNNEYIVPPSALLSGESKSCGCGRVKSLIGFRFGKGLVIEKVGKKPTFNKAVMFWRLLCDCGSEYETYTSLLYSGGVKSCGCLLKPKNIGNLNGRLMDEIQRNAKTRGLVWDISKEYLWNLYAAQNGRCAISGLEIVFAKTNKEAQHKRTNTASLDRIDNDKGYVEGNVQWVHKHVNLMKHSHGQAYFIELCKVIANYNSGIEYSIDRDFIEENLTNPCLKKRGL